MEMTVKNYDSLKKNLDSINNKIQQLEVESKYRKEQINKILNKYNVKNISELKKLKEEKETEVKKLVEDITKYITETSKQLSDLDIVLHS